MELLEDLWDLNGLDLDDLDLEDLELEDDDDVQQLLPDLAELVEECQLLQDLDHFEDFDLEDLELEDDVDDDVHVELEEEEEEEEVSPLCKVCVRIECASSQNIVSWWASDSWIFCTKMCAGWDGRRVKDNTSISIWLLTVLSPLDQHLLLLQSFQAQVHEDECLPYF